jgi:uncharacterized protein with HEPN domain
MPREARRNRDDPARDPAFLLDMLQAARNVRQFVAGVSREQYAGSLLIQSAVERQVEIIGEAARGVSRTFRDAHPEVPWAPIMAQRHRLAHEYAQINQELIWTVATVYIPALIDQITPLIPPPPVEEGQ